MSTGDDYLGADTPFGEYAQRMQDDAGIDVRAGLTTDQMDQWNDQLANPQQQQQQDHDQPDPGGAHNAHQPDDAVLGGLLDGQTVHDQAHWLGKAAGGAGEMVGANFVPSGETAGSGDFSGGIVEDTPGGKPREHHVVIDDDAKHTVHATFRNEDGTSEVDHQYDAKPPVTHQPDRSDTDDSGDDSSQEIYDSAFDDGYQEGLDDAAAAFEDDDYYSS